MTERLNWTDGQFQSVVLWPACKFSENVSDLKSHYKPVYHWFQFLLSKKSSAHETKVPEADRPLLLPCFSPPPPTVAATAPAPMSPIEKATTYPSYSVLFYYSWQILCTALCSQPKSTGSRVQVPAHPSGTCCPSSVRCEAFKRKTTTSLSIFFNHKPKNNLIFKNANSLPITFSCFWHHCLWSLSQVCGLARPACTSRRWPQAIAGSTRKQWHGDGINLVFSDF